MKLKINNMYVSRISLDERKSDNNFISEIELTTWESETRNFENALDIANKLREIGFNVEVEEDIEVLND